MSRPSSGYTKAQEKKARNFVFVLYPDSQSYDCQLLLNRLSSFWDKFYYILHDRDTYSEDDLDDFISKNPGLYPDWHIGDLKKPHYHVVAHVDSPCMLGRAMKKAGLESGVFICNDIKKAVQYLVHLNHPSKFQYSKEEVITCADDLDKLLAKTIEAEEKASLLLEALLSDEITSIISLAQWAIKNHCWDELRRGQHIYTSLLNEKLYSKSMEVSKT